MKPDEIVNRFSTRITKQGNLLTLMTPFVVCERRKTLYLHIAKTGVAL